MTPSIEFHDVRLAYRRQHNRAGSLKEMAVHLVRRQVRHDDVWALDGVSFTASPGEVLAVIGRNGAGKSTAMKLIARVLPPTDGRVIVRGTVAPMIELAAGLDVELTTVENVLLYGSLLGRTPQAMRERLPAILDWAGLEGYEDVPVRTFSSGMLARLGFAVCIDVEPDVLVVDEVLAVGDESFQQRSLVRIRALVDRGGTVVLVSHNMATVERHATRVIWLDKGTVRGEGDPHEVVEAYRAESTTGQ